jgi:hypothetical protein
VLVFDERPAQPAAGVHALVIGISAYPHLPGGAAAPPAGSPLEELGLAQLRAPALTAVAIHRWLLDNRADLPVPLHTARLLLAPSAQELAADPAMAQAGGAGHAEIRSALHDWRADMRTFARSRSLLFFSGHGLGGVGNDALMLPADLGDPADVRDGEDLGTRLLRRAISLDDVVAGMAPPPAATLGTIGREQVYLVDACRNRTRVVTPDATSVPIVWDEPFEPDRDGRALTVVLATMNDQLAYVGRDGEATVFGQAVRECLDGAAAVPLDEGGATRWPVDTPFLGAFLPGLMNERATALRVTQTSQTVRADPVRMVSYAAPPELDVTFAVAGATPAANLQVALRRGGQVSTIAPLDPAQRHRLPMGGYEIVASAITPPPADARFMQRELRPPRSTIEVAL